MFRTPDFISTRGLHAWTLVDTRGIVTLYTCGHVWTPVEKFFIRNYVQNKWHGKTGFGNQINSFRQSILEIFFNLKYPRNRIKQKKKLLIGMI